MEEYLNNVRRLKEDKIYLKSVCLSGLQVLIKQLTGADQLADRC